VVKSLKSDEVKQIRDAISKSTNARYEILSPEENYPPDSASVSWYMAIQDLKQSRSVPHSAAIWENRGLITVESGSIGNTNDWIEESYGEEAVYPLLDMNLTDFGNPRFRKEFLKPFPSIQQRLDSYDDILKRVSKKHGMELTIRYDGGKGLAVFYLDAIVKMEKKSLRLEIKRIEKAIEGLKDAYEQIASVENRS
jgi:hypothetical protein